MTQAIITAYCRTHTLARIATSATESTTGAVDIDGAGFLGVRGIDPNGTHVTYLAASLVDGRPVMSRRFGTVVDYSGPYAILDSYPLGVHSGRLSEVKP